MSISTGFEPIARSDAHILILGSLPGKRSLEAAQYYAHPQNAFWHIMRALFAIDGGYEDRCEQLTASGIALWDVLKSSARPGSMDTDIRMSSSVPNDFSQFFSDCRGIRRVCFNGKTAESVYRKMVLPGLGGDGPEMRSLPSTSPAYASLSFDDKLVAWREALIQ